MKGQKYFFDANNFDQVVVPEPDPDLPPPPPVFSLEELGQAKDESFAQGRAEGIQAEKNSRQNYVAAQVATLNNEIRALILAEQIREKRFEAEVVALCHSLMSKLFPILTENNGTQEIEAIIAGVLQSQDKSKILIEVPTEDVEEIYTSLLAMKDVEGQFEVVGAADLTPGSCRMKWQDGGAVRDHKALAESILKEIDDVLAQKGQKGQNNESMDVFKGE